MAEVVKNQLAGIRDKVKPITVILGVSGAELSVWPLCQDDVVSFLGAIVANKKVVEKFGPEGSEKNKLAAEILLPIFLSDLRQRTELMILKSLRTDEDAIDEAVKDLHDMPAKDFNDLAAGVFIATCPGGVSDFLEVWGIAMGQPRTSAAAPTSQTSPQDETASESSTSQIDPLEAAMESGQDEFSGEAILRSN